METKQILRECAENLALLTQLGLSIVLPPILCLYAANWLRGQYSLGIWVTVLGLVFGVGGGLSSAWKLWSVAQKRREGREAQKKSGSGRPDEIGGERNQD